MSLPYVSGNWTFSAESQPTSTTTKSITLPTVNWASDYTLSPNAPKKWRLDTADDAMYYRDVTGPGVRNAAVFAYGTKVVQNVYTDSEIPSAARLPVSTGSKALTRYKKLYHVANSVNGEEMDFEVLGNFSVSVPGWGAIPQDVVEDFVIDYLAHLTGAASDIARVIISACKGDLDLTR